MLRLLSGQKTLSVNRAGVISVKRVSRAIGGTVKSLIASLIKSITLNNGFFYVKIM